MTPHANNWFLLQKDAWHYENCTLHYHFSLADSNSDSLRPGAEPNTRAQRATMIESAHETVLYPEDLSTLTDRACLQ